MTRSERQEPVDFLITGITGLLGCNLALAASKKGAVWGVTRKGYAGADASRIHTIDIGDRSGIRELFDRARPRVVIHSAAETRVDECERDREQAFATNVVGTRHVAQAAESVGATFVYVSTDAVFDGVRGGYSEGDEPSPVNVYAKTKLQGEQVARDEVRRPLIVRVNFFGWNVLAKQGLAEWILSRLAANEPVPGFADVTFSPLNAYALAEIILELADRGHQGVFHLGSRSPVSKFEFARNVASAFGFAPSQVVEASVDASPLSAKRPKASWLRVDKVETALGRPMPTVQEGIGLLRRQERETHLQQVNGVLRGDRVQ